MGQINSRPYTFDRTVRLVISVLSFLTALYFLYMLRGVLLPFIIAWLIAYMLNPVVKLFQRKFKIAHSFAVVLTLLSLLGVLCALFLGLSPFIEQEIWQINTLINNYQLPTIGNDGISLTLSEIINRYINFNEINEFLTKDLFADAIEKFSPTILQLFSNTIALLVGLAVIFITILYLIFIMMDYDKINELRKNLIPPKHRSTVNRVLSDVEVSMNKYFRSQALICCILAILYAIGFQIIGLPMAIIFGFIVGFVHMIPYLQVITFPIALLLCWLRSSQTGDSFWAMIGLTILIYIIVQCIMDLVLTPKIMGKAMGLNPAIILLSLSIWGYLFGILGMIIAIPMTTLLLSYYKEFIKKEEQVIKSLNNCSEINEKNDTN